MYATNGSVRIYYELAGPAGAPPLVLLRGLGRTVRHWGKLLDLLGDRLRILVLDNRGVGKSSAPLPPYETGAMAADVASALDHAGIAQSSVFGLSLGGMIAQKLALQFPERVSRLVLGCTRAGGRTGRATSSATLLRLTAALALPEPLALAHTASVILAPKFLESHPDVVSEWQRIAREQPTRRRGYLGQIGAALRHDSSRDLARLRVPTLVVSGDADRMIDVENSRHLARAIPGARLEILSGAGHDLPLERPEELAELLTEFCLEGG
jgi:pimeloyl-ACP methyl ester carboxylesterase